MRKLLDRINESLNRTALDNKYEIVWNNGTKYYLTKRAAGKVYLLKYDDAKTEVVINAEDFKDE